MPFVKFSYPVSGHKVGEPVHVDEATADRYIRDGVATKTDPPKVEPKEKPSEVRPPAKVPAKALEKKPSE
jgi:hypothetical protein